MNIFPFHGRHSEQIGMPFLCLMVGQRRTRGTVLHCKRACFEAQGKLFCNALVIKLLRSSHLAYLLLCIFRYSFLFKLHSLLASCRIHLHHQAMRKTVSLLLFSLTTTSQILFFQQEKNSFPVFVFH